MHIVKTGHFGEVEAFQLGFGPIGPPLMSVFLYVVDGLLIDTGQQRMQKQIVELLEAKTLGQIILTHHHEDHSGNAAVLSKRHSIPATGHPLTAEKMRFGFPILPYQRYVWGKAPPLDVTPLAGMIETDRYTFTPIHTPGHSKDHTVFLEKQHGWLFSGDLYLGEQIKFFRSDERFGDQMASLKKVLQYDFKALLCSHNPSLKDGKSKLSRKLQYLEDLYGNIQQMVQKGYSQRAIIKALDQKNDRRVRWVTLGNASFANMARSAMASMVQH